MDHPRPNIGLLLSLANVRTFTAATRVLSNHGMTPRGYSVLEALQAGPRSQRELAVQLELDPSRIVSLVDQLEQSGLVTRQHDPTDRRVRLVTSSDAGTTAYAQARSAIEDSLDVTLRDLDATDRETLSVLLERIIHPPTPVG